MVIQNIPNEYQLFAVSCPNDPENVFKIHSYILFLWRHYVTHIPNQQ